MIINYLYEYYYYNYLSIIITRRSKEENYYIPTDQLTYPLTNRPTEYRKDRRGHRVVTLPIICTTCLNLYRPVIQHNVAFINALG